MNTGNENCTSLRHFGQAKDLPLPLCTRPSQQAMQTQTWPQGTKALDGFASRQMTHWASASANSRFKRAVSFSKASLRENCSSINNCAFSSDNFATCRAFWFRSASQCQEHLLLISHSSTIASDEDIYKQHAKRCRTTVLPLGFSPANTSQDLQPFVRAREPATWVKTGSRHIVVGRSNAGLGTTIVRYHLTGNALKHLKL